MTWKCFQITGPLWGESTGDRWIPSQRASGADIWSFDIDLNNSWTNIRMAGDMKRHDVFYDFIVIKMGVNLLVYQ